MTRNIHIVCLIIISTLIISCSKDELMSWDNRGAVRFENTDTLRYTFAYMQNPTSDIVEFPLILSGFVTNTDRSINIRVVSEARNPQTKYEIMPAVLEAGQDTAYLKVKIYCTENLITERDTLTFEVFDSNDLLAGDKDYRIHSLTIYNRIERPTWWDTNVEGYMGSFEETKMVIFQELFKTTDYYPFNTDILMELYPEDFMIEYNYRVSVFKKYVKENYPDLQWGMYYDYL